MSWYDETRNGQAIYRCRELNGPGIIQAFSTKINGNMAFHTGDDPQTVIKRRQRFLSASGLNLNDLVAGAQTHGVNVQVVTKELSGSGAYHLNTAIPDTDALVTKDFGSILSIYTADCVPIFIYDPATPAIGLVHAGWRGTLHQIVTKTLAKMKAVFNTNPAQCTVAIGPAIGIECFIVAEKVATQFAAIFPGAIRTCGQDYQIDLVKFNIWLLIVSGVRTESIINSGLCTGCLRERFYSYRADKGTTGRMMGIISLPKTNSAD
jgi:YfiH family protein